jgi:tetratricopeptide (TPR) repeat protein
VLLDDAATEEQVRPLLPGCPTCGVLVTSRRALDGLDGAQPLPLGAFAPADSLALLDRVVGPARTDAEPAAAARLVELCGHLPLAVALAARRLRSRPAWLLADLVARLEQEERRLAELAVSDLAVRAVFELSYAQLDEPHRCLFRRLALHPGRDLDPYAAAALTGQPVARAAAMLETLLDEHLLEQTRPGRYRQHDLLRVFAGERLDADEDPAARAAAIRALLDWLLRAAGRCRRLLAPHRRPLPYQSAPSGVSEVPEPGGYDEAMAWYEAEHLALLAAVPLAAAHGHDDVAWQLPIALSPFVETRRIWRPFLAVTLLALDAVRRIGDPVGEAWIENDLGILRLLVGDPAGAREHFASALAIRERIGDEWGVSQVLNNLGEVQRRAGDLVGAIPYFLRDLEMTRRLGDRQGESVTLNNIGKVQHALGQLDAAQATLREALAAARAVGDRQCEAEVVGDLAEVHRTLGDLATAARDYERCAQLYDQLGDSVGALTAVLAQAELAAAAGDVAGATRLTRSATARLDDVDEPDASELRDRLTVLQTGG